MGRAKENVLPSPSRLSIHSRPPCRSRIRRESVSPSPVPSVLWRAPRPPRWNASKIRSRSCSATPMPVSRTLTTASAPSARAVTATRPPAGVNLTAFVSRLSTTCRSLSSSAGTVPSPGSTSRSSATPCRSARSRIIAIPASSSSASDDGTELELHPARLDLRQVEDLVDQLEQVAPRAADVLDVLLLALVEIAEHAVEQHFGEADHGVERRAQLVRHAGQELGLVAARHFSSCDLRSSSRKTRALWMATAGMAGERLQQLHRGRRQEAGRRAPDHQDADGPLIAHQGHRGQRAPPVAEEHREVRVRGLQLQVLRLARPVLRRGAADERVGADVRRAQRLGQLVARTGDGAQARTCRRPGARRSTRRRRRTGRAARLTIVASASSSTSRLALTAWLTSPSARSSCRSCTLRIAIAPWAANVVDDVLRARCRRARPPCA